MISSLKEITMHYWYRLAAAVSILLIVLEALFPEFMAKLPLSGDALQQSGVLFLLVYFVLEVFAVVREIRAAK